MTERKKLKIGLIGFGCVGYGLYRVLEQTPGLNAEIKNICVKNKQKQRPIPIDKFTFNVDDLIDDPEINLIVELIDDANEAFRITKKALQNGKPVVSANKKMIAENFRELLQLQSEFGAQLLYEAAACASIPIIRNLEEYYDNDTLKSIKGIVNGSTNFILCKAQEFNWSFEEALSLAQELGYAESDPSLDVDGHDAAYKLQILSAHAFGQIINKEDMFTIGISKIGEPEIAYAKEKGLKLKLVAHAGRLNDGSIYALVAPRFVSIESDLYRIEDAYNGVQTETFFADKQFFSGKGAGDFPTASAVLSDISALSYDYRYEYKKLNREDIIGVNKNVEADVYLRVIPALQSEAANAFKKIRETYSSEGHAYITGTISLTNLEAFLLLYPEAVAVFNDKQLVYETILEETFIEA